MGLIVFDICTGGVIGGVSGGVIGNFGDFSRFEFGVGSIFGSIKGVTFWIFLAMGTLLTFMMLLFLGSVSLIHLYLKTPHLLKFASCLLFFIEFSLHTLSNPHVNGSNLLYVRTGGTSLTQNFDFPLVLFGPGTQNPS